MHVKITSGSVDTYPYNVGQLRRDNPNTSFPKQIPDEMLESYGVYTVVYTDVPSIDDRTQKAEQASSPSLVDGAWTIVWTTSSKTAEETQAWDDNIALSNRGNRDGLISETDFYALSDVTMTSEMTTYRQALRDITTHTNWPNLEDADWPTKP
tara:strand:+ start:1894 stop:2352 length:459 start_codon:yes stop_codon:yes gene_type:complete